MQSEGKESANSLSLFLTSPSSLLPKYLLDTSEEQQQPNGLTCRTATAYSTYLSSVWKEERECANQEHNHKETCPILLPTAYSYPTWFLNHRGLQLTTKAGAVVVIEDPVTAEQLVVRSVCHAYVAAARTWHDVRRDFHLIQLVICQHSMNAAVEEFIAIFGQLPSWNIQNQQMKPYLQYVLQSLPNRWEKMRFLDILMMAESKLQSIPEMLEVWKQSRCEYELYRETNVSPCTSRREMARNVKHSTISRSEQSRSSDRLKAKDDASVSFEGKLLWTNYSANQSVCSEYQNLQVPDDTKWQKKDMSTAQQLNIRYKTQLCRYFVTTGSCLVGPRCHYAHGEKEMRLPDKHPKFKTKVCRKYKEKGHCTFGDNCFFLHVPSQGSLKV